MSAHKSSAVADEPVEVLFALQPGFDLLDFSGAYEVFAEALHEQDDPNSKAFECTIACAESQAVSKQGARIAAQITYKEAYERLSDFDVVVVVGGDIDNILKAKTEPMPLLRAYTEVQKRDSSRERTVLAVCTGAMFLAAQGLLSGLAATMHPDHMTKFEHLCSYAAVCNNVERTEVMDDERYVVNNLRFDIDDEDSSPYIHTKSEQSGRRGSHGRKGSMSFKGSNTRRESTVRRAAMRLGGMRVITTGGMSSGVDASLYLVSALVDEESANAAAKAMAWNWQKGVVVDGLDV
ncbi:hypothetical protein TD95_002261 [Thielaviopsis punctulata]|uniref:DJ-1/PfpI domain-containing protein n=1 Tax=Thielaviopsis punctulata TaxID=72032 RepID=A0A0F4ZIH3_9PEZI|nr:hypothetical protein TD95_002261 [Thielaviopsis punctulata]